jgi:hypothetical protein
MTLYRTFCLLALLVLSSAAGAQTLTLSAKPLADSLKNPDLLRPEGDPALAAARTAVAALLLNKPAPGEQNGFHARLALFARHRDTRLGRLFFACLQACPTIENLAPGADRAEVTAMFPLALGSGARVAVTWQRHGETMLIGEFSVQITGNAGALFAGAGPYFSAGEVSAVLLDAPELDLLLGRDPAELLKPQPERPAFDYDAALARVFALEQGAPAALLEALKQAAAPSRTPAERIELLLPYLADEAARQELRRVGTKVAWWEDFSRRLEALAAQARPGAAPTRPGGTVSVASRHGDTEQHWQLTRDRQGRLVPQPTGATREEGNGN